MPGETSSKTAVQIARELREAAWSPDPPADRLTLVELAAILDPRQRVIPNRLERADA